MKIIATRKRALFTAGRSAMSRKKDAGLPPRPYWSAADREKWSSISMEERRDVVLRVARQLLAGIARDTGTGISGPQERFGGWLGTVNTSFACRIADGGDFARVAQLISTYLHQDAVMAVTDRCAPGMRPGRIIRIELPADSGRGLVDDLYVNFIDRVRDAAGRRLILGHASAGGVMTMTVSTEDEAAVRAQLPGLVKAFGEARNIEEINIGFEDAFTGFLGPLEGRENDNRADSGRRGVGEALRTTGHDPHLQRRTDALFRRELASVLRRRAALTQAGDERQG
ncbi:hypothetical protein [Sutterella sp.]|uniref:hypothetical protein n=1 Tax=Sutterella sp. TaxID=1981025 RepID=UPI0026DEAF6D|nr:hypothetical protein [Sutterella sp.]MDO5531991.1 hypothetical protein [Sutterella sp.]